MPDKKPPYALARQQRAPKDPELPPSDAKTLTPDYLLTHQNHFDPNVYTPEGVLRNKRGYVSPDTTQTRS